MDASDYMTAQDMQFVRLCVETGNLADAYRRIYRPQEKTPDKNHLDMARKYLKKPLFSEYFLALQEEAKEIERARGVEAVRKLHEIINFNPLDVFKPGETGIYLDTDALKNNPELGQALDITYSAGPLGPSYTIRAQPKIEALKTIARLNNITGQAAAQPMRAPQIVFNFPVRPRPESVAKGYSAQEINAEVIEDGADDGF